MLVLVDQLRADRLGVYGSTEELTPFLDRLAKTGFYFLNARAVAPWTYPSTVSLHTGLYPSVHRAGRLQEWWIGQVPTQLTTLAEYLQAHGYATAGFIANPYLKPESGFPQGFLHYEHDFVKSWAVDPKNNNPHWWQRTSYADSLNARALDYLRAERARPVFVYMHYIDVHGPWDAAPFLEGPCEPDWDCGNDNASMYRRSIRYVDRRIGELYGQLEKMLDGNFIFVVTSDHGRALLRSDAQEPLKVEKASLHDFNLRVPLIIGRTRAFPHTGASGASVSLVDVFPTLAQLLFPNRELGLELDGVSLDPILRGETLAPRTLFAENDDPMTRYEARASLRDWIKFIEVDVPEHSCFEYDLHEDPQELAPRLGELTQPQRREVRLLQRAFDGMQSRAAALRPAALPPETIERLKALGYTQ